VAHPITMLLLLIVSVPSRVGGLRSEIPPQFEDKAFILYQHRYYVTAAPQCVYPDGALGGVLNTANFDAIYGEI
jgi:hypothetical protein